MTTLKKAKILTPHPYPSFSNSIGANNGTTPPTSDLNTEPPAMAEAAYFSNESM